MKDYDELGRKWTEKEEESIAGNEDKSVIARAAEIGVKGFLVFCDLYICIWRSNEWRF